MSQNFDKQRKRFFLDLALVSLVGSENLKDQWWITPNKQWNLKTPESIWLSDDWESVYDYVMIFCYGR